MCFEKWVSNEDEHSFQSMYVQHSEQVLTRLGGLMRGTGVGGVSKIGQVCEGSYVVTRELPLGHIDRQIRLKR